MYLNTKYLNNGMILSNRKGNKYIVLDIKRDKDGYMTSIVLKNIETKGLDTFNKTVFNELNFYVISQPTNEAVEQNANCS